MRNVIVISLASMVLMSLLPNMAAADLNDGLMAYYPFSGNANDETGNGYDGIMHGVTATEDPFGNPNSAFAFDGSSAYIDLGTQLNFPAWNSYAISVWFLQDGGGHPGPGSYGQKILSKQTWFNDLWLSVYPQNGTDIGLLAFQTCYPIPGAPSCFSNITDNSHNYSDNAWHHVAINKNGTYAEMWVDGVLKGSVDDIRTPNNNVRLMVGFSDHGDSLQQTYWSGNIDELRIYDRVLVDSEIQQLFGANVPELAIASDIPAAENELAEVDVAFTANGSPVAATTFSIDYDQDCLFFDDIDFDPVDGIFDNIAVHVPADFTVAMFHDLGDSDGEIDISIADLSPPIATLPDGVLVTATFTPTCSPASPAYIDAGVGFSADPAASFADDLAQDIDGTTTDGSVRIYPGPRGDCNFNGEVTAADLVAETLEIFDGDGELWGDVPGGSFAGSPVGCDANADTEITAGDVSCTILLVFGGSCGAGGRSPAMATWRGPVLAIDGSRRLEPGSVIRIPVRLASRGHELSSVALSLDLQRYRLRFDATDADRDGIPDAVHLLAGTPFLARVSFDPQDHDGELDIVLAAGPGTILADGVLLEIEVEVLRRGQLAKSLGFSVTPAVSFGDLTGRGQPGRGLVTWKPIRPTAAPR